MRALRPDRVFDLPSGLWVLDAVQPVAVVLDRLSGAVVRVVSWRELPPAPAREPWPPPRVLSDGTSLWAQQQAAGPLVRIGPGGVETAAWTGGLVLAACSSGAAWCTAAPPAQELVAGPDPHPVRDLGPDRLLRVDADGSCTTLRVDHPVRAVQADEEGLLVQVDVEGWTLRALGADLHEVVRPTRWLRLLEGAALPDALTVAEHGLDLHVVLGERRDEGGAGPFWWYEDGAEPDEDDDLLSPGVELGWVGHDDEGEALDDWSELPAGLPSPSASSLTRPLSALGLLWRFGWPQEQNGPARRALATAHDQQGAEVGRWDLGPGTVETVVPVGERLCVVLSQDSAGGQVLVLDPASAAEVVVLLAEDSVDISAHCWPLLARPLDVDSYLAQTLATHSALESSWHSEPDAAGQTQGRPLVEGMRDVRTTLVGDWPHTRLEWTFSYAPRPGLVLRRQVPLFDELGRPSPPEHADIHLMEDLHTRELPAASDASDGVLDV